MQAFQLALEITKVKKLKIFLLAKLAANFQPKNHCV
jgi:hypothetical protein